MAISIILSLSVSCRGDIVVVGVVLVPVPEPYSWRCQRRSMVIADELVVFLNQGQCQ
jgi:hypothetical protein